MSWDGEDVNQLHGLFKKSQDEVAALLLDPVQLREPLEERLRELRELTHAYNALLILDEAKTALRVHLAGVQGLYHVAADLTVLSKSLANGFPLAAVLGPAEILDLAASARIMGTFNGELVAFAAALQTVSMMAQPESTHHLESLGRCFIDGVNDLLARHRLADQIRAVPYRWPCMPYLWFRDPATQRWRLEFYRHMATYGVLMLPNHMNFLCLAHTSEDIDEMLQTMDQVLLGFSSC
jgi:glutamate-1-semialdehyde 2,1-aminomutase